ncbi:hypothetical protein J3F84DRAFT_389134 [Trichoderma pleuroticola]
MRFNTQFVLIHLVIGVTIDENKTTPSEHLFDAETPTPHPYSMGSLLIICNRQCKSPFPLFLHTLCPSIVSSR